MDEPALPICLQTRHLQLQVHEYIYIMIVYLLKATGFALLAMDIGLKHCVVLLLCIVCVYWCILIMNRRR
jgi:hypothetical protein